MNEPDLKAILKKQGFGIVSELGKGAFRSQVDGKGKVRDVESGDRYESLCEKAVTLNYSGKCIIRIKFYRRRLADYSRANCEKFIIDSLRYGGVIRDDSEKEILLIDEGQVKVETNEEERVELTLEYEHIDLDNLWVKKE